MKTIRLIAFLALFMLVIGSALALKGSIGNGRIYIDEVLKTGETKVVERTIQVNNRNNMSIAIKVAAVGEIQNITEIIDKEFMLEPGESKDARFRVMLSGEMNLQGRIAVGFAPATPGGAGVGLQSLVQISTAVDNSTIVEPPETKPDVTSKTPKKNPIVGVAIICIIILIGIFLYLLISKRVK